MIADRAGNQNDVAGTRAIAGQMQPVRHGADPGGGDEHAVRLAALDDLGVAGDDLDAGLARRRAHALRDAVQIGQRKALFEDEAGGKMQRPRACHRQIVDRAMHRQRADVAAGKEQRRDDIAVGGHGEAPGGRVEHRLVVALRQQIVVERVAENFADELRHGAAAGAVGQIDPAVLEIEFSRSEARRVHDAFLSGFASLPDRASRKRP